MVTAVVRLRATVGVDKFDQTWDDVAHWPREDEEALCSDLDRLAQLQELREQGSTRRVQGMGTLPLSFIKPVLKLTSKLMNAHAQLQTVSQCNAFQCFAVKRFPQPASHPFFVHISVLCKAGRVQEGPGRQKRSAYID